MMSRMTPLMYPCLSIVHGSQSRLALPVLGVGHENGPSALPLGSDNTTHLSCRSESSNISLVLATK